MVKIRLRRMGAKGKPFYRIVVAKSTSGRDGAFVEILGTYDPLTKPKTITLKKDRALHWLLNGAQPTETTAYLLKTQGVLDEYFTQRPAAKRQYKFLDKRVAATASRTVATPVVEAPAKVAAPEPAPPAPQPEPAPVAEAEVVEAAEPTAETAEEAPAAAE